MIKKIILSLSIFLLLPSLAFAEERWIYITIERTPIINRAGLPVDRIVYYSQDRWQITTGGEWIIPEALKSLTHTERYQQEGELLILVDVPPETILPGQTCTREEAAIMKSTTFGIPIPAESGVTP